MLESNKGLGLLKVIVNGIEITDSETWDRVVKSISEKDKEIAQLKSELEELKKNSIVPKFKVGKTLFFITNIENQTIKSTKDWFYVLDNEGLFIETNNLPYNDCFYDYTFDRVFSTRQEAEEELQNVKKQLKQHKRLREEIEQLKFELEELKKNVIVPKFKVGDVIWIIKRIKKEVANGKIIKQYSYFNSGTPENLRNVNRWRIRLKNNSEVTKKEYELFSTQQEAEEALRKLEEV